MTTYKGIKGLSIQTVAGDPSPLATGDIWYSSTTRKVRGAKLAAGAWASGTNIPTATSGGISFGNNEACVHATGNTGAGGTNITEAYNFDGSSWTAIADVNLQRRMGVGCGTTTAGAMIGGYQAPLFRDEMETWDGSSWTEIADLNSGRAGAGGGGTTTAAFFAGGEDNTVPGGAGAHTSNEIWNGTSWTEDANLNTGRRNMCGSQNGSATAGLVAGGGPTRTVNAESWDGSSWTEVANLSVARDELSGSGTSTAMLAYGGGTPSKSAVTDEWDGSSWTAVASISTARTLISRSIGGAPATLAIGGITAPGAKTANTEEWTVATAAVTFTSS